MPQPEFLQAIPILRIFDEAKARAFYVDFLGFRVDWEHRFAPEAPLFLQVSRPGLVFHLSEHHGDACPGSATAIMMTGLDAFHAEITTKNNPFMKPGIEPEPWDARVMTVIDPFGNRLLFRERNQNATLAAFAG
jgi:catechol 2,3-dioxygenase-like lactoylglutathione lyase family enzyme